MSTSLPNPLTTPGDAAMTRTGTQNRPYTAEVVMVRASFIDPVTHDEADAMEFDWNDRSAVRDFASKSDRHIRSGGSTYLEPI